jgi:hypothetical protein
VLEIIWGIFPSQPPSSQGTRAQFQPKFWICFLSAKKKSLFCIIEAKRVGIKREKDPLDMNLAGDFTRDLVVDFAGGPTGDLAGAPYFVGDLVAIILY